MSSVLAEMMGPGWLMFFQVDENGGGPPSPAPPATKPRPSKPTTRRSDYLREQELALEEDDITDLIILMVLSGLID